MLVFVTVELVKYHRTKASFYERQISLTQLRTFAVQRLAIQEKIWQLRVCVCVCVGRALGEEEKKKRVCCCLCGVQVQKDTALYRLQTRVVRKPFKFLSFFPKS